MTGKKIAIMHYSAPPVIGGVEAVMAAHARVLVREGYEVSVIAGRGEEEALLSGVSLVEIPALDSRYPPIMRVNQVLEEGEVPPEFEALSRQLEEQLAPILSEYDTLIVHNIFTKHFNLPLTAALFRLLDAGKLGRVIAYCHDFTWTSPSSRSKMSEGYPWDLLRTYHPGLVYVVVSEQRRRTLAGLLGCPEEVIHTVYNGVDPKTLLGLTDQGKALVERLNLLSADLNLLMPVRVTRAKNIEFAMEVVGALKREGLIVRLVVTGPPDPHDEGNMTYFASLKEKRADLNLEEECRFIYESGEDPEEACLISSEVVGDLYRVSDIMFMPSHREGFGMPILEAGFIGLTVFSADVPASVEIGGEDVYRFDSDEGPEAVAEEIMKWAESDRIHQFRRRVRQKFTWEAIYTYRLEDLLA